VTSKNTYKKILNPHLYDSKGKYCSPKLSNEKFLQKLDKDLYEFCAESFAMSYGSGHVSIYAKEIKEIIKKHFGK